MKKQKVVLFCRSATKEQLVSQLEQLKQYADANNCEVVAVVAERRNGISARRWKLNLAMRIAQKHSAGILTPNISRVSRTTQIAEKFMLKMKCRKIQLYTMTEGMERDLVDVFLIHSKMSNLVSHHICQRSEPKIGIKRPRILSRTSNPIRIRGMVRRKGLEPPTY